MQLVHRERCPICQQDHFRTISEVGAGFNGQIVVMCMNCGHCFHNPYDLDATTTEYESNEYSISERGADVPTQRFMVDSMDRAMERARFIKSKIDLGDLYGKYVFELGSGDGSFLKLMKDIGLNTVGAELSLGFAEYSNDAYGVNARFGNGFNVLTDEEMYNIGAVAMFHVIEHLANPLDTLMKISKVLAPGGLLYMEYPNILAASQRTNFDPTSYFHRYHVHDFSDKSMASALWTTGFEVLARKRWSQFPKDKNTLLVCRQNDLVMPIYVTDQEETLLNYMYIKSKVDNSSALRDWVG